METDQQSSPSPEDPDCPLNARELIGKRMRVAAFSVVGTPLTIVFLVPYLRHAKKGLSDRMFPYSYAAVAFSMAIAPLWILTLASILL